MIQLAWLWVRHQPHSALAQWFNERVKRRTLAQDNDRGAGAQTAGRAVDM
jgi:transposase